MTMRQGRRSGTAATLSGALLISGALIGLVGNALHPHTAGPDVQAAETLMPVSSLVLTGWVFGCRVLMWRQRPIADLAPGSPLVPADGIRS